MTASGEGSRAGFRPPVEQLPDLGDDLPGNDLHFHGSVGPHGRAVAGEDVIIGDGPRFHVSVGAVLPEILSHPHSPFVPAETAEKEKHFLLQIRHHGEKNKHTHKKNGRNRWKPYR